MKLHLCLFLLFSSALMIGCTGASGRSQKAGFDACSLVTADEFAAQQGEALKDAKATNHPDGDLDVSQCFLAAPTFSKSVSLIVTTNARGKEPSREMEAFWE